MKFLDATADDIRQVIQFVDSDEFMADAVRADLDDWINDSPGDHLWSDDSVSGIILHLTRLNEGEKARKRR